MDSPGALSTPAHSSWYAKEVQDLDVLYLSHFSELFAANTLSDKVIFPSGQMSDFLLIS